MECTYEVNGSQILHGLDANKTLHEHQLGMYLLYSFIWAYSKVIRVPEGCSTFQYPEGRP